MFGWAAQLGRGQEEGDLGHLHQAQVRQGHLHQAQVQVCQVWHLHQAQDDCSGGLVSVVHVLPLPQAQVCTTCQQIDVQTKMSRIQVFLKGFCLRNGTHASIGGRWYHHDEIWWVDICCAVKPWLRRILQVSQEFAKILRNGEAQLGDCLLHPPGEHSFPPDVQRPRLHRPRLCLLHHPHHLRCLRPLCCGLWINSKKGSIPQQFLRSQFQCHL